MSVFDLLFLICFVAAVFTIVRIAYLAFRRRFAAAKTVLTWLLACAGVYVLVLIGFSLMEPQRTIAIGEPQCFDDWCITVERAASQKTIGAIVASGNFRVITLRVSSRARRSPQRESDVYIYLLDDRGRRFEVSEAGQAALARSGLAGEPVTSFAPPGGSFESRLVFDIPSDALHLGLVKTSHSWFPVRIIIADPGSWLHRPTVVPIR